MLNKQDSQLFSKCVGYNADTIQFTANFLLSTRSKSTIVAHPHIGSYCRTWTTYSLFTTCPQFGSAYSADSGSLSTQGWKIHSFLSEVSVCWSCTEKQQLKQKEHFPSYCSLRALPATCRSFQQSPQPPAVAITSGNSPSLMSRKQFPSAKLGSCFLVTGGRLQ